MVTTFWTYSCNFSLRLLYSCLICKYTFFFFFFLAAIKSIIKFFFVKVLYGEFMLHSTTFSDKSKIKKFPYTINIMLFVKVSWLTLRCMRGEGGWRYATPSSRCDFCPLIQKLLGIPYLKFFDLSNFLLRMLICKNGLLNLRAF